MFFECNKTTQQNSGGRCERRHGPELAGGDHYVLAKTKLMVFYCQICQAELENSVFA